MFRFWSLSPLKPSQGPPTFPPIVSILPPKTLFFKRAFPGPLFPQLIDCRPGLGDELFEQVFPLLSSLVFVDLLHIFEFGGSSTPFSCFGVSSASFQPFVPTIGSWLARFRHCPLARFLSPRCVQPYQFALFRVFFFVMLPPLTSYFSFSFRGFAIFFWGGSFSFSFLPSFFLCPPLPG